MKNNSELTKAVAAVTGKSQKESETAIQAVLTSIRNLAEEKGKLTIQEYGTFSIVDQKERKGRNPSTGETITIPAKRAFKFKASK